MRGRVEQVQLVLLFHALYYHFGSGTRKAVTVINPFSVCRPPHKQRPWSSGRHSAHFVAMNGPARFVSRRAKVSEEFGNPQHRGKYCEITSYRPDDGSYEVGLLSTFKNDQRESVRVNFSDLQFIYENDFEALFPRARVVEGRHIAKYIPRDVTVNFFGTSKLPLEPEHGLNINASCRLFGTGANTRTIGTVISNSVRIELEDNHVDIAEFERIYFEFDKTHEQRVNCVRGHIVFRSCHFRGNQVGVEVGCEDDRKNAQVNVVFESCTFQRLKECAVKVHSGHVTFVNCQFITNVGVGVAVAASTSVDLTGCSFSDCTGGVLLPSRGQANIRHCNFHFCADFGLLATNGSEACVDWCSFLRDNEGIVVEGGAGTYVNAVHCKMERCEMGVRVGNGTLQVSLQHMHFQESTFGVYVAVDTKGLVKAGSCDFDDCDLNLVNLCGDRCTLVLDGIEEEGSQLARIHSHQFVMMTVGIKYGYPVSAEGTRVLSEAGIMTVCCANCKSKCPAGEWYKKCARCREARYCSRACQVKHYSAHHVECVVTHLRSVSLSKRGYIWCIECGEVEAQSADQPHCACSRCLMVFYCSRQCQVANWKVHKRLCKPHKDVNNS